MFQDNLLRELVVDNFAGGGGASTGMELALGYPVDIAVNHDGDAIAMHKVNHPYTQHFQEDVFAIDPERVTGGRPVGIAWFSPDCKHFSRAKGGKPVEKKIRGLSWVVLRWALSSAAPRVIFMENVPEIKTWCPLIEIDGKMRPAPQREGETFNGFVSMLTTGIAKTHPAFSEACEDYYATDPIAIDKLLTVETPKNCIWECACGGGHLSERLTERGLEVYSTDVKYRGYKYSLSQDFLTAKESDVPFVGEYDILTNPPYKYAKEFVIKALELLPQGCKCYMFLKLTFLEGKTRYSQIFKETPPKNVYVFSERIMCAKNAEFEKMHGGGGSCTAYAWFVWQKDYKGDTHLSWI